ncbi:hypothetical protein L226DRAFT_532714 [Lentinus tigrinus ALCF2SS1-7]|uniref:Uncharacterized protein n=1 Tax=Lentinus tigrinus ALCF2SS1-6 TaxID=1328759 RepID=A0A5C2SF17_9APHY|nr:hypothetical protein L227DRAFT_573470 [Lentinus tigrinus ALCF2SS1-6]RPD77961.1 hypothetical protein L226DRAFT_532714 [Lentinus tigrinus ALCF2SS1-7]
MTDVIVTGAISTIAGTALAAGTSVASSFASASATASAASSQPIYQGSGSPSNPSADLIYAFLIAFADMFYAALGALEIGLVLAAITFGVMATKAISYFRGNSSDGALVKTTVAVMVLINVIQMVATIHGTYTIVIVNFGSLNDFVSPAKSIMPQILFTTLTGCIAQAFFAFKLHAIKRQLWFTMLILFFTVVQLAISIYAFVVLLTVNNLSLLIFDMGDWWPMIATYSISLPVNIVIAAVAYVWMQKPYVLSKHGRTTFMSELEYWTVKSLFFCGLVSLYNAITVGIGMGNMLWMAGTFVLGNLYTISVLLTLDSRMLAIPVAASPSPRAIPQVALSDRASATTLTDDMATWEDMVKSQAIQASLTTATKEADLPAYATGYHVNDGAV